MSSQHSRRRCSCRSMQLQACSSTTTSGQWPQLQLLSFSFYYFPLVTLFSPRWFHSFKRGVVRVDGKMFSRHKCWWWSGFWKGPTGSNCEFNPAPVHSVSPFMRLILVLKIVVVEVWNPPALNHCRPSSPTLYLVHRDRAR